MKDNSVIRGDRNIEIVESYKGPVQDYTRTPRALPKLELLSLAPN
jgi:outer membrane receptor for monomeric catechols